VIGPVNSDVGRAVPDMIHDFSVLLPKGPVAKGRPTIASGYRQPFGSFWPEASVFRVKQKLAELEKVF
jgi:hypothetical protein